MSLAKVGVVSETHTVTLIGKPGCHLCDEAREVVSGIIAALDSTGVPIRLDEHNILDDANLHRKYAEEIPVVLIDGRMHAYWRVDPVRFRDAFQEKK